MSLGQFPQAIESFDQSIELRKGNPWVYINRGSARSNAGDYEGAKKDFLKALDMNPELSDAYVGLSVVYLAGNEFQKALKFADLALKKNPRNGLAFNQRGWTKYKMDNLEEALFDFDQGIRYAPRLAILYSNRGICHTDQGNFETAIRDFNRALKLHPDSAVTLMNRGAAYWADKQYEQAHRDMKKAVELAPQFPDANNTLAWFLATCEVDSFRDGEVARKRAEVACEASNWKNWIFIDTLAAAEAESGNFRKAVEMQEKAIEIAPQEAVAECRSRLELYQSEEPFRSKSGKVAERKASANSG